MTSERPSALEMRPATGAPARRIHDRIFMSPGMSNSYLVATDEGNVLINTGMDFEAPLHRRAYATVSSAPLRAIVITQGHVDHVGGVGHFREPGVEVIAQRNLVACQEDDRRIPGFRLWRNRVFFGLGARVEAPALVVPSVAFDATHAFELGGVRFELYATPGGETIDSCIVWLPRERVLFSGNALGPLYPCFPNLGTVRGDRYRFALPYVEAVERMLALEPETLITGHFEPIVGWERIRSDLTRLRDAVRYVHDETVRGMNEGKDPLTLMRLPPALAIDERYGNVSWAVRSIWEGYGGWFHFNSTAELYDVPPREVYADLVEAAGADAVAARPRARLDAGEPLHAVHLAEVVLAGAPRHREALEVYLGAHEALLAEAGENLWSVRWLRRQIRGTQQLLGSDPDDERWAVTEGEPRVARWNMVPPDA